MAIPALGLAAPVSGNFAGVPAALQPYVDRGEIAGAVLLVADKDEVLHLSAVGVSDLATGRAAQLPPRARPSHRPGKSARRRRRSRSAA